MIKFSADELFEIAKQIERDGARFYRKAAESTEGENRDLLIRLAEMEDEHERAFESMRNEFATAAGEPPVFDPDNKVMLYLQSVADGKVFGPDPSESLSGNESLKDVLTVAIGLEKDSVIFYQSMKGAVSKVIGATSLNAIIAEEIGHVLDLDQKLKAVS
ncbi:MAG: ferritin family protein [Planctomycetota bacterium]|nr:ferritin family protein [Planctomycetota bacterium]